MTGTSRFWAWSLLALAAPLASAGAQGPIGTLPRGNYLCELPGDAAGRAGVPQPDASFMIESASRYSAVQGTGNYLRRGETLVMSSGPRQGESFAIHGPGFLRRIEGGKPGRLRCVHSGN